MKVLLVELEGEQIRKAKEANGARKKITHAVVCGEYGQIFGTEKQCRKYYSAWSKIFPKLFGGGKEVKGYEPVSYESTFDLVNVLIAAHDSIGKKSESPRELSTLNPKRPRKKGLLARLFGK
ncbi:hypothetical protein [Halomonas sp. B23F22_10]|uniref:hypothetical protein n=1 Tax=Halomonas sp. B23F22_10 TaxID=3459515 RepID=UPI00373F3759